MTAIGVRVAVAHPEKEIIHGCFHTCEIRIVERQRLIVRELIRTDVFQRFFDFLIFILGEGQAAQLIRFESYLIDGGEEPPDSSVLRKVAEDLSEKLQHKKPRRDGDNDQERYSCLHIEKQCSFRAYDPVLLIKLTDRNPIL